ncbi:hypothetical protein Tco_1402243 [Tanacetum coccineum]
MGDENPIRTLKDYSKPSHEGYRNSIELPVGNNMVPLRSDTIRLVQNGCSFHGLQSEDPNQHVKDFLKLVDSLDLDDENRERTLVSTGHLSYCMEDPEQAFVEYDSGYDEARWPSTIRKISGTLPSNTVKNPKLSTSSVLSARSYPIEDPQCLTHVFGSVNTITIHPKQQNDSHDNMAEEEKQEREGDPEDTNTIAYIEERRDTLLL